MKITKARRVTYLGVPADVSDVLVAGNDGERVAITHWVADAKGQPVEHPAGTIVLKHIKGNGTRGTLVALSAPVVLKPGTPMTDALARAKQILGVA